jgi:hypothetical protein
LAFLLVSAKFAETVDQATIVLDLVGDNSLAILKISYRQIVSRTLTQGIGNFAFESRVSPLQIGNGCLRHGSLQHSRIHAEKNVKKQRLFDMDQGAGETPKRKRTPSGVEEQPKNVRNSALKKPLKV